MREIRRSIGGWERPPTAASCTIEKFTRMHPPMFTREFNPIVAENWVQKIEKILKVLYYTDERKVLYATFQLAGEAKRWWTARYPARYIKLSRFALCLILNEYEKTRRFKKGLSKDIRRLVGMLQIREFPVLVDKAVVVEASLQKDEVVQEQKKRPAPSGS
ncbi:uncharacterized protein LOC131167595 [Malania oleifera]|uniref:uncharacterized protein LOC131167595 n=1 Tax=Malania oleifera TaxID=397392 RepID=UPI0025AE5D0A|nr:uncharacterized protein LOC131167595 [Malania oleifera]